MKKDIPRSGPIVFISIPALIVTFIAYLWSIILLLEASKNSPFILLTLFVLWVSAPFVGFSLLFLFGYRFWRPPARVILYVTGMISSVGSLLVYNRVILPPAGTANAFIWLVTPAASFVLLIVAFVIGWLISRSTSSTRTDT